MKPSPVNEPASARWRLGLTPLALAWVALAALASAAAGYGLAQWLGATVPWSAALGAALGMLATAVPMAAVLLGLARTGAAVERRTAVLELPPGALTREQFGVLIEREWARARRYGNGAALLLVEIDRSARLIDSLGRDVVARLLHAIVCDIAPTLRGADALGVQGDGQLAVFLAQADATGALDVAERIRERTEALETEHAQRALRVTVSVGVAHLRPAHLHLQALFEDAAEALYAARQSGGNCVRAAPIEAGRLATPGGPRRNDQRAPKP